ncbi:hypothetical protein EV1_005829 [Malus domestica]
MATRSDDRRTKRSGLDAFGGGATGGCRRSARLAQHYVVAAAAQGSSNTAGEGKEYRSQRRKITAQGGPSETQGHHKREITTDGTSYTPDDLVEEYRLRRGIRVVGWDDAPNPIRTFDHTRLPQNVIQEFSKAGFVRPTPIQAQVWPMDLEDRDLIGIAQPGSGKMLAQWRSHVRARSGGRHSPRRKNKAGALANPSPPAAAAPLLFVYSSVVWFCSAHSRAAFKFLVEKSQQSAHTGPPFGPLLPRQPSPRWAAYYRGGQLLREEEERKRKVVIKIS